MARPRKIEWPIGFEELLRYALPKKRPEDRFKFYRLFLRDYLHPHSTMKASEDEIEKAFISDRQRQFDENTAFHIRLWIGMSLDEWKSENYRKRAQAGAAGLKRKRQENGKTTKN